MVDSLPVTLPEDPKEAQRIFHSLSVENQLHLVLQARGKDRLRYLFLSEHPEQLVQQLPELEVFLTVKEAGEKDCLDLISLTTPEQFQFLLDLDFWKKDQLDAEKVLHWMEILLESGEKKVIQFIQSADIEFIALLLKKFIHATAVDGEPLEVMDKVAPFTLDQYHFVHFRGKRTREVFEPFLQVLYQANKGTYQRLMDSLTVEFESELEETGYRLRNSRLKDYGFPDFEESLEIYRFLNPDAPLPEGRPLRPAVQEAAAKGNPIFYLAHPGEGPFFSSVLSKIDDSDEHNRLLQEIAALCNKAIVAEAIDLSNIVAMERVVKKVYHTLNLGLQYVSKDDDLRAVHILRSLPAQKLFQYGISTTLLLRRKAESLLKGPWFSNDQENLVLLDPPHFETFEGILRRRPTLYRDWVYEDFKNPQDLKEADEFLVWLKTVITFLGNELKVSPLSLKRMDLSGCYPDDWREMTLSAIFLTALANQILRGTFQFEAIGQARVKDFLARVFERDDEGKGVMNVEVKNGFRDWLRSVEGEELKGQHLLAFQDFCLDLFEVQYGKIPPGEEVDPRFVKGLLIRK